MVEREQMILDNEKLIYSVIKKMKLYNKLDDYYDVGMIGLIKAVDSFDKSKGYAFSSYAFRCIANEIKMETRKFMTNKNKANYNSISLNQIIHNNDDGNEIRLCDTIPDDIDIENYFIEEENKKNLYEAISKLADSEALMLNLIYGLNGYEKTNQEEIAAIFDTSQTQISRYKNRIVRKLRKYMEN